jgi:hypothetical protein
MQVKIRMGDICNIFIILLDLLLRPFTPATGVQLPLGTPSHLSKSLSILGAGRFFGSLASYIRLLFCPGAL